MAVTVYFDFKIALDFLDTIPNRNPDYFDFYLLPISVSPSSGYSTNYLAGFGIKKEGDDLKLLNGTKTATYTNLVLENDDTGVYLYKNGTTKPEDPRVYARNYSTSGSIPWASSKCELSYIDTNKCKCTVYLIPKELSVNVRHHIYPEYLFNNIPDSVMFNPRVTIRNGSSYLGTYSLTKGENTFEDNITALSSDNNYGVPYIIDRNDSDIFVHSAIVDEKVSNYTVSFSTTSSSISRYISTDRVTAEYVSDHEFNLDVYYTTPHGRISRYYAIYEYSMLVPVDPDMEEGE
jgi:hypothetical protein